MILWFYAVCTYKSLLKLYTGKQQGEWGVALLVFTGKKKKSHSGFPIASHDVISSGNCGFVKKHLGWNPDGCAAEDQRQGLPCSVKGWFEATDQVEQDPPAFLCCGNTKPWPFLALLLAVLALSSWAGRRLQDGVGASVAAWQGT